MSAATHARAYIAARAWLARLPHLAYKRRGFHAAAAAVLGRVRLHHGQRPGVGAPPKVGVIGG